MSNMRPVNSPKASQGYLNLKSNTPGNEKWVKTYNNYDMYPEMFDGTTIKIEPDKDIILDCISKVKYGNNDLNEASEKLIEMVENPEMITENYRIEDVFKESTLTMLVKCRFITE